MLRYFKLFIVNFEFLHFNFVIRPLDYEDDDGSGDDYDDYYEDRDYEGIEKTTDILERFSFSFIIKLKKKENIFSLHYQIFFFQLK